MLEQDYGARASVTPTRLRVPRLPTGVVCRDRLVRDAIGVRPVTLVRAPAGSGKTTLVAQWAALTAERGEGVGWLTLEQGDDHPYEFWSAVIEALLRACPAEQAPGLDALSPPPHAVEERFIVALLDALAAAGGPAWLVIDDAHRLDNPEVLRGLEFLLTHAHPHLGIVLSSRYGPPVAVHRQRIEGRLGELGAAELAFTDSEAGTLFGRLGVPVEPEEVTQLVRHTEGWAVGLRLAAMSVSSAEDPTQLLAGLADNPRAISEYLFSEIIQHLSPDLVGFLLTTCTPTHLPTALAAHLSGRADAGEVLDRLCRANALVLQSGEQGWYHYHGLLRTYLVSALARHDIDAPRRQHALAATWFAEHEEPARAIHHAARAQDDELLFDLVRRHGLRTILQGQGGIIRGALSPGGSRTAGDQKVAIVAALAALDVADLASADEWLSEVEGREWPTDEGVAALRSCAMVRRSLIDGDILDVLNRSALLTRGPSPDRDVDLMVRTCRAPAMLRAGDYEGALEDLLAALEVARGRGYDHFVLWALSQLSGTHGARCDFRASSEAAHAAIAFATPRGWVDSPRLAYAYLLAAWTSFQTGDVLAQAEFAERGLQALEGVTDVEVETGVRSMHALAMFEAGRGRQRFEAAQAFHDLWQGGRSEQVSPALVSLATPQEVRLSLAVGRFQWAEQAARRVKQLMPGSAEAAVVHAQLLVAKGHAREALDLLRPVHEGASSVHVPTTRVKAQVMVACLESTGGNQPRAFEALRSAVEWSSPNHFRRAFIDVWPDVAPLLAAHVGRFGTGDAFVSDMLADRRPMAEAHAATRALTDREHDILCDLPTMMTIGEIAKARGISENTVKTHVRSIYQKLGAGGRTAAVKEARARGII